MSQVKLLFGFPHQSSLMISIFLIFEKLENVV